MWLIFAPPIREQPWKSPSWIGLRKLKIKQNSRQVVCCGLLISIFLIDFPSRSVREPISQNCRKDWRVRENLTNVLTKIFSCHFHFGRLVGEESNCWKTPSQPSSGVTVDTICFWMFHVMENHIFNYRVFSNVCPSISFIFSKKDFCLWIVSKFGFLY